MALNFPASPVEGQTYSAEGALYRFSEGRWVLLSQNEALTAIFGGSVGAAGWWVGGDLLIQWGVYTTQVADSIDVAFPRSFKTMPVISATPQSVGTPHTIVVNTITATGFRVRTWDTNTNAWSSTLGSWIAVGGALDEDRTPKILAGGDAMALFVSKAGDTMTGPLRIDHAGPRLTLYDTDAAADARMLSLDGTGGAFTLRTRDDAEVGQADLLKIERSGNLTMIGSILRIDNIAPRIFLNDTDAPANARLITIDNATGDFAIRARDDSSAVVTNMLTLSRTGAMAIFNTLSLFPAAANDQIVLGTVGGGGAQFRRTGHYAVNINTSSYGVVVSSLGGNVHAGLKSFATEGVLELTRLNGANTWRMRAGPTGDNRLYLDYDGTAAASLTTAGTWAALSDPDLKGNIQTIVDASAKVMALAPRTYHIFDEETAGFLAPEVARVVPEASVSMGEHMGVTDGPLLAVLWQALREALARIDALEAAATPTDGGA